MRYVSKESLKEAEERKACRGCVKELKKRKISWLSFICDDDAYFEWAVEEEIKEALEAKKILRKLLTLSLLEDLIYSPNAWSINYKGKARVNVEFGFNNDDCTKSLIRSAKKKYKDSFKQTKRYMYFEIDVSEL